MPTRTREPAAAVMSAERKSPCRSIVRSKRPRASVRNIPAVPLIPSRPPFRADRSWTISSSSAGWPSSNSRNGWLTTHARCADGHRAAQCSQNRQRVDDVAQGAGLDDADSLRLQPGKPRLRFDHRLRNSLPSHGKVGIMGVMPPPP